MNYTESIKERYSINYSIELLIRVFFVCFLFSIFSSNPLLATSDSVYHILYEDSSLTIKEKLSLVSNLSDFYQEEDLNRSLEYKLDIYNFSVTIGDKELMLSTLEEIGDKQNNLFRYQKADSCYQQLYTYIKEDGMQADIANVLYKIASNNFDWSKYKDAKEYYEKARVYYDTVNDKQGTAKSIKGISKVFLSWSDYATSLELMKQARSIYSEINDEKGKAEVYMSLGVIMQEWNKLDRALDYYNQALAYYTLNKMELEVVNMILHIGDVYLLSDNFEVALNNYRVAQNLEKKTNHKKLRSIALSNIGEAYLHLNQLDSALHYQIEALKLKNEIGDERRCSISFLLLGKIYYKMDNPDSAINYLQRSLELARSINIKDVELKSLKSLSDVYVSINRGMLAYDYLKQYQELKDVVFNDNTNKLLEGFAVKYESDKRTSENVILKQNNNLQLLQIKRERDSKFIVILLASFIIFAAFTIVFFVNYRNNESRKNLSVLSYKNKEITRQKEKLSILNEELEQSREKFKGIVDNATIGIYQTNPEGEVLFANKNLINTLGFAKIEELQQIDLNVEHPDRNTFLNLISEKNVITGREDVWRKADGSEMYVIESAWRVNNSDGSIRYIEGLVEDITRRKKAENELKKSQIRLREINNDLLVKNEQVEKAKKEVEEAFKAKSSFLANISHEIRTPMNAIIGFTEMLLTLEKDSKKNSYVTAIDSSSKSLLALINDILDLSKIQAGKENLNLNAIKIRSIINELQHIFSIQIKQKNLEFILNIDDSLPKYIKTDGIRIRQVLFNLVGNAVKFTEKGFVRIDVIVNQIKEDSNHINLSIEVKDSGPGISNADQKKIFSAFAQSENIFNKDFGGSGLGLAITKQIVELLNGELTLESRLGKGSNFIIYIPKLEIVNEFNGTQTNYEMLDISNQRSFNKSEENSYQKPIEIDVKYIPDLKKLFIEKYIKASTYKMMEDIIDFSKSILLYANTNNLRNLKEVSSKLLDACDKFEIEKVEVLLNLFKTLFDEE